MKNNSKMDTNRLWEIGRYKAPFLGRNFFWLELIVTALLIGFCVFAYLNGMFVH